MRVKVLIFVPLLLLVVLGLSGQAHAEKVRTNQKAKVYNRPGEQGKVVAKVKEGQAMTILAKEGRWLKVRVSGRTGYVPRSKVDLPADDDEVPRNTRRRAFVDGRSTKRGFGGSDTAPDDRIGADATGDIEARGDDDEGEDEDEGGDEDEDEPTKSSKGGDDDEDDENPVADDEDDEPSGDDEEDEEPEDDRVRARVNKRTAIYVDPDEDSDEELKVKKGDILFVGEKQGDWIFVETEEGDAGYMLASELDMDEGEEEGGGRGGRMIDVRARLGFMLVSQTLTSAGGTTAWPDRYKVGSSAIAVAIGGAVLYPYKKQFLVGGELAYDLGKAIPGITFDPDGADGPMAKSTTSFTIHNLNIRAVGGYDFKKKSGMVLFARLAYHYESFLVANVKDLNKNNARLPSEVISGPMVGTALSIPRLTEKIGARISLDALLFASSVKQTVNLEDGADPSAKRITFGAGMTYRWKPSMDINVGYDLNYASLKFGAPLANSMRGHTGTAVGRSDLNHTVAVGVAKAF